VSHRAVLTSTCASCVTQGRISHQYVLPMSHRARSHRSFLFLCSRSQFCSFYLLLSIYFFSDFTPPEEVVRSSPHSLFFLLLLFASFCPFLFPSSLLSCFSSFSFLLSSPPSLLLSSPPPSLLLSSPPSLLLSSPPPLSLSAPRLQSTFYMMHQRILGCIQMQATFD
jgi:hypothetical protein